MHNLNVFMKRNLVRVLLSGACLWLVLRSAAQQTALAAPEVLLAGAAGLTSKSKPMIRVEGSQIILENDWGCKLAIWEENGRYGLGTFLLEWHCAWPVDHDFSDCGTIGNNTSNILSSQAFHERPMRGCPQSAQN